MEEEHISDEVFVNVNGYLEYRYSQGKGSKLVHRRIAFKEIYNPEEYPYDFEEYEVHHKNSDKLDNRPENLELQLPGDHYYMHFDNNHVRIDKKNKKLSDYPSKSFDNNHVGIDKKNKKISDCFFKKRKIVFEKEKEIISDEEIHKFIQKKKSLWEKIKEFFGI